MLGLTRDFDGIVVDLNLPDSSGLHTFESIHAAAIGLPIVVCTADVVMAESLTEEGVQVVAKDGTGFRPGAILRALKQPSLRDSCERAIAALEFEHAARERVFDLFNRFIPNAST